MRRKPVSTTDMENLGHRVRGGRERREGGQREGRGGKEGGKDRRSVITLLPKDDSSFLLLHHLTYYTVLSPELLYSYSGPPLQKGESPKVLAKLLQRQAERNLPPQKHLILGARGTYRAVEGI